MKKKLLSFLLALALCLSLLPVSASAAETDLPDWYFLFAVFKNVDADCIDAKGAKRHAKYTMTQDEIDFVKEDARDFEEYMNQVGVMRAHVDVVEVDAAVTELEDRSDGGYLSPKQAEPLLKGKVDLDQYDHVTCVVSLNIGTSYLGLGGSSYENGTGHTCINLKNREYCLNTLRVTEKAFPPSMYVHELLHFMENMNKKWGAEFGLHDTRINFYSSDSDNGRACYTDIILNRARGDAGTGVFPAAWQYPPRVLRTMTELTVPSGVTGVGDWAFYNCATLKKATIPSTAASIGNAAFQDCAGLTEVTISSGAASIGRWTFGNCAALAKVSIPASVTSIGYAAFWNTAITDVYYGGTEAQWKSIQFGEYNGVLTKANIHYNSLMADVRTTDYFAKPVAWALENGITAGTGYGKFSPNATCTQAQVLTFLWRASGSPAPSEKAAGSEYYAAAIQWAKEQGITGGTLVPSSPCTRSDAVTYLWKLAGSPAAGSAGFTDVSDGAAYSQAVAWAVERKITSGTGSGRFSPDAVCTRGQIVTFLCNALAM